MVAGVAHVAFCFFTFPYLLLDFRVGFEKKQINPKDLLYLRFHPYSFHYNFLNLK
jgi:hypothetical protein